MQLLIPLELIQDNPWQPRLSTDPAHVAALADSIARDGLLQVPLGRLVDADGVTLASQFLADLAAPLIQSHGWRVQLAFGHSRLKAYRQLAETHDAFRSMPVEIRAIDDVAMATYGWSENAARKDLNPLEEAQAIQKRLKDFDWTHAQAAEYMGLERSVISNKLRLLKLPAETQEQVRTGELSQRQALALVQLADLPPELAAAVSKPTWINSEHSTIWEKAPEMTAEAIRQKAQSLLDQNTMLLSAAPFTLDDELTGPDVVSPTCRACDKRMQGANRCPVRSCFNAKAGQLKELRLVEVSAALGIPAEGRELYYKERDSIYADATRQTLLDQGCPKGFLRVTGGTVDKPEIVCFHGENKKCVCIPRIEKAQQAQRQDETTQKIQSAAAILQPVIDGLRALLPANRPVLMAILSRFDHDTHKKAVLQRLTVDQVQDQLARLLISREEYNAFYSDEAAWAALPKLQVAFNLSTPSMMGAAPKPRRRAPATGTERERCLGGLTMVEAWLSLLESETAGAGVVPGLNGFDARTLASQRHNLAELEQDLGDLDFPLAERVAGLWTRLTALERKLADVSANTLPTVEGTLVGSYK